MLNNKKIVVLIPCRSGSKSIKDKNIKLFRGKPLFVHSIDIAKQIDYIDEIYVSTDSEEYQNIAIEHGALAPFLRPYKISDDYSSDLEVFQHFIEYHFHKYLNYPAIIIHLRPTYPLRTKELLEDTIKKFMDNYVEYDSLRTVVEIKKSLFKMYLIENQCLIPTYKKYDEINEPYNQARQILPKTYLHNGCIDIIKTSTIICLKSMTGEFIYPYVMNEDEIYDIDSNEDFIKAEERNII